MSNKTADIQEMLVRYLKDTHAMEKNVSHMLDGMINTTEDPAIRADLEHHKEETKRHEASIRERIEAHGESISTLREMPAVLGALGKGIIDQARPEKPGKNARDGFVTEHLEIAAYELLERVAQKAGDTETVRVARENRADEEAMAQKIAATWDKVIDLTLQERGIRV
jgi:ferritin-like metal-binding protein YciE